MDRTPQQGRQNILLQVSHHINIYYLIIRKCSFYWWSSWFQNNTFSDLRNNVCTIEAILILQHPAPTQNVVFFGIYPVFPCLLGTCMSIIVWYFFKTFFAAHLNNEDYFGTCFRPIFGETNAPHAEWAERQAPKTQFIIFKTTQYTQLGLKPVKYKATLSTFCIVIF